MFGKVVSVSLLAAEAQRVIELRLVRLAWGGRDALAEAELMVTEKICAAIEATVAVMLGGTSDQIIDRYRERVAHNLHRLLD